MTALTSSILTSFIHTVTRHTSKRYKNLSNRRRSIFILSMSSVLKWLLPRFPHYSNALLASVFKISQENLQMKFLVNKKNRVVFLLSANWVISVIKNEVQMNSAVLKRTWLFSLTTSIIPRVALTYPDTRIQPNTKPCISTEKESCCCFSSSFAN